MIEHTGQDRITMGGHDWGPLSLCRRIRHANRIEALIVMNGVHPICFQRALSAGGPQFAASAYID